MVAFWVFTANFADSRGGFFICISFVNISFTNGDRISVIQLIDDFLFFDHFFIDDIDQFMIEISVPYFAVLRIVDHMKYF